MMTINRKLLLSLILSLTALAVFFLFAWQPEPLPPARGQVVLLGADINLYKTVEAYQKWVEDAGTLNDNNVYDVTLDYIDNPNVIEGFKVGATAVIDSVLFNRRGKPYLIRIKLLENKFPENSKTWFVVPQNIAKTIKPGAEQ